jgi:hypothetical protein
MVGRMWRRLAFTAALVLASPAGTAHAQAVEVTALAAPDAFSTAGRDTGLSADLWRGAAIDTLKAVLPRLAQRPLSPAAAALARRVLATGAPGPEGLGAAPELLAVRAGALAALGVSIATPNSPAPPPRAPCWRGTTRPPAPRPTP